MLILPIQEHGRSFHFQISFPISFFKDLKLLLYRSFTCLVRIAPKIFCILCGYCKGCCFTDFFLSPFIVCIYKIHWFFELILYPVTLLKVFISCKSSLVGFLESLMYTIESSSNSRSLTSSFPIWIPLNLLFLPYDPN